MWGWVGVGAEYSKGLEACGGTSSCSIAEITVLVFGVFICVFFLPWCELSAVSGSLGREAECVLEVCISREKQISVSY